MSKRVLFLICVAMALIVLVRASDPDILFDYIVPPNVTLLDGNFFTYTKIRDFFNGSVAPTGMQASLLEFRALDGQSVSLAVLRLAPGGVTPPHTRPHATGLFFVLEGQFEVGFVDTTPGIYTLVA
ncbi:hypothetical protein L2E82_05314 [Cichorium intybus]|uniref:Uncharacterized protein n=1 Tax=Cichorium intybus TaxID=13427 RepID=A0ACB9H876_CICIN|nr:hypothetical protein L2E82_05314 [Cichorium intybus]